MLLGATGPDKRPATWLKPGFAPKFACFHAVAARPGNAGTTEYAENTEITEQKFTIHSAVFRRFQWVRYSRWSTDLTHNLAQQFEY
ncbi:hypothetical protein [Thiohalophilus sp.]|uniref:hypothetical protein n=1 Tax=Thiohalophilus sp. TaxID=3028392 RepID=UPI002ACE3B06|nr:hypothetical protein [Thiohalophilus sp.]MDZ7662373.1 hypothetical protein [Thiohalophilus sp.]